MQCACAILSSAAFPALRYFYTLSHKRHDFRKKKSMNIKCVFRVSLQLLSETFHILRKTERDVIHKMYHHHHHVPEGLGMLSCSLILKIRGSQPVLRGAPLRAPHALPRGSAAAPGKYCIGGS